MLIAPRRKSPELDSAFVVIEGQPSQLKNIVKGGKDARILVRVLERKRTSQVRPLAHGVRDGKWRPTEPGTQPKSVTTSVARARVDQEKCRATRAICWAPTQKFEEEAMLCQLKLCALR